MGSYTDSTGLEMIRKQVAIYLENRDNVPCNFQNVFLSSGALHATKSVFSIMNCQENAKPAGIMLPCPGFNLHRAVVAELGMAEIMYDLDEENNWSFNVYELKHTLQRAKLHCNPRGMLVINPGNPTGTILQKKNIEDVIRFAYEEGLFLFADEVYEHNIHAEDAKFLPFRKVMYEMGPPYCEMELASFMSCSKGYLAECGVRGGCCEVLNLDTEVKKMLLKSLTAQLCPNTFGQVAVYCLSNPPKPGEPSYETFKKDVFSITKAGKEKAKYIVNELNRIKGFKCRKVDASFYAFPCINLPEKSVTKAKALGMEPDSFYCMELLEKTGIVSFAGSLFGQKEGTYHIRIVFLSPLEELKELIKRLRMFHESFLAEYE